MIENRSKRAIFFMECACQDELERKKNYICANLLLQLAATEDILNRTKKGVVNRIR